MPIYLPEHCLRGRIDCEPLAQVEADDGSSFICCGHNDGTSRHYEQDVFRLCWKNAAFDEMSDWDYRDLLDTASVINQALSADANIQVNGQIVVPEDDRDVVQDMTSPKSRSNKNLQPKVDKK